MFQHRGRFLKQRAIAHTIAAMHTLPACSPGSPGEGPKKIGHRAGFNFHSEFKRQYARGLILEAVDQGLVEMVPCGLKNKYRLMASSPTNINPLYVVSLGLEGAKIIHDAKMLVCEYLTMKNDWVKSVQMERDTGLYENDLDHSQCGYWAWLIREELAHEGVLMKMKDGKEVLIKLCNVVM